MHALAEPVPLTNTQQIYRIKESHDLHTKSRPMLTTTKIYKDNNKFNVMYEYMILK